LSPAFSLRTKIVSVEINGKTLPFKLDPNPEDQHLSLRFPVTGESTEVTIRMKNDFGLTLTNELPPLGSTSRGLRVLSNSWNAGRNQLTLEISGVPGRNYDLGVWNPEQISSVDGASLTKLGKIHLEIPASDKNEYSHRTVVIHFGKS
jgi:hypothetical protein